MIKTALSAQQLTVIEHIVCNDYGITHEHIYSRDRHQQIAAARQVIFYLVKKILAPKYEQMAKHYRRDRTTFIHSRKAVEELLSVDKAFLKTVNDLESKCRKELRLENPKA